MKFRDKAVQLAKEHGAHVTATASGDGLALVKSLGADCIEKEMRPEHLVLLADLLKRGEADHLAKPEEFRRYGSARKLYTFNIDNAASY